MTNTAISFSWRNPMAMAAGRQIMGRNISFKILPEWPVSRLFTFEPSTEAPMAIKPRGAASTPTLCTVFWKNTAGNLQQRPQGSAAAIPRIMGLRDDPFRVFHQLSVYGVLSRPFKKEKAPPLPSHCTAAPFHDHRELHEPPVNILNKSTLWPGCCCGSLPGQILLDGTVF